MDKAKDYGNAVRVTVFGNLEAQGNSECLSFFSHFCLRVTLVEVELMSTHPVKIL